MFSNLSKRLKKSNSNSIVLRTNLNKIMPKNESVISRLKKDFKIK